MVPPPSVPILAHLSLPLSASIQPLSQCLLLTNSFLLYYKMYIIVFSGCSITPLYHVVYTTSFYVLLQLPVLSFTKYFLVSFSLSQVPIFNLQSLCIWISMQS